MLVDRRIDPDGDRNLGAGGTHAFMNVTLKGGDLAARGLQLEPVEPGFVDKVLNSLGP